MLIIFSGLPGTGKTTISRLLSQRIKAFHIRIDTLEHSLSKACGIDINQLGSTGYEVAYVLAGDNLKLGFDVIADSVNPLNVTRKAWRRVAQDSGVNYLEVELTCLNKEIHRQRVEDRKPDIKGFSLPDWNAVINREYHEWPEPPFSLDTSYISPEQAVKSIMDLLDQHGYLSGDR